MNELSVDDKLKEEDCLLYKPKLNNYGIPICDFCGADALAFHTWGGYRDYKNHGLKMNRCNLCDICATKIWGKIASSVSFGFTYYETKEAITYNIFGEF